MGLLPNPVRFIPSPIAAVAGALEGEELYDAGIESVAEHVKKEVESVAPIGASGNYHHSIEVDKEHNRVQTVDPFGHLVEWGSINNQPYAPLRKGVLASGLRLVEDSKPT